MPPRLPERYELEVRIGRDGDVEEWLATDLELSRPCLVRILGPESTLGRRKEFLDAVRSAAGVSHLHLAQVFTAGDLDDGAFSVSEWPGGIRLVDRKDAALTLDPATFLPNAEGLARALAAIHARGVVHGSIDASAVFFPVARPAKLGALGRHQRVSRPEADTQALSEALEEALTGQPPGSVPPSEVIDGVSPALDDALDAGRSGELSAEAFADLLASVPVSQPVAPRRTGGRRWMRVAVVLLTVAAALIVIGGALRRSPLEIPGQSDRPLVSVPIGPTVSTVEITIPASPAGATIVSIGAFDPFGDGEERDQEIPHLTDGDLTTTWRTESYFDPLPLLKAGVGLRIDVTGTPSELTLLGISSGSRMEIRWSAEFSRDPSEWELVTAGVVSTNDITFDLPPRTGGQWLVWLIQVPADEDVFRTSIAELVLR